MAWERVGTQLNAGNLGATRRSEEIQPPKGRRRALEEADSQTQKEDGVVT